MRFSFIPSIARLMLVSLFALLLAACGQSQLELTADFSRSQDIEENADVYFGSEVIGQVADVEKKERGSMVVIEIEEAKSAELAGNAALVANRTVRPMRLELYNAPNKSDQPLEDGQKIKGLDSQFELLGWGVGNAIGINTEAISEFKEYLGSDEFEQDKKAVTDSINSAVKETGEALRTMEEEFAAALDELVLVEDEMAAVIDELGSELAPMAEDIARSGAELTEELEQFSLRLAEETDPAKREAGRKVLESMIQALEKMEQGVERGVDSAQSK